MLPQVSIIVQLAKYINIKNIKRFVQSADTLLFIVSFYQLQLLLVHYVIYSYRKVTQRSINNFSILSTGVDNFLSIMIPLRGLAPFFGQVFLLFFLVLIISDILSRYFGNKGGASLIVARRFNVIRLVGKIGAILSLFPFLIFLGLSILYQSALIKGSCVKKLRKNDLI